MKNKHSSNFAKKLSEYYSRLPWQFHVRQIQDVRFIDSHGTKPRAFIKNSLQARHCLTIQVQLEFVGKQMRLSEQPRQILFGKDTHSVDAISVLPFSAFGPFS